MKNIFANKAITENVDTLQERNITVRRFFHPAFKPFIMLANKKKIIVDCYPYLEKNEQYIFAAGHSFPDEIAANLSVIDRHTYVLIGTTNQLINNPSMAFLWMNGLIYVNKCDNISRHDSFLRMKKVLNGGSSVMLFPEGVLNNSENLLCNNVYPGFYHLCVETGKKVVPIVSQTYNDSDIIRVMAYEPIDLSSFTKKEALMWLRDQIATMRYEMCLKSPMISRSSLDGDIHEKYMECRKQTYMEVKWTADVWDEEIMFYKEKEYVTPQEAREYVDDLNLSVKNASIVGPVLVRRLEDKRYDFKNYMHNNWDK